MAARANTLLSFSASSILRRLSRHYPQNSTLLGPLLYVLSPSSSLPPSELSDLVSFLTSIPNSVGCIGASLPISVKGFPHYGEATGLSLAQFNRPEVSTFRSVIPGIAQAQVGRWHGVSKAEDLDIRALEDGEMLAGNPPWRKQQSPPIPLEIQLFQNTANDLSSVIYLSDSAPEGLTKSLRNLTGTSQVGFIASSTPFTTGRPFTLFHNTNIYSSGAVGVCIASPITSHVKVNFPRLQSITEFLTVSSSEGNLVHGLDGSNPSRLLLNAIERFNSARAEGCLPLDKGDDFYLGVSCGPTSSKDCIQQVYHIVSGDPSRGSIALEGEDSPAPGTQVQLLCAARRTENHQDVVSPRPGSLSFITSPIGEPLHTILPFRVEETQVSITVEDDVTILADCFVAASENGCVVSRAQGGNMESPWKTTVPYGLVSWG